MREEHRVVTVLFADLVGSTALAERLDSEEVMLVMSEAISRVVTEIELLGGYVKDLAGDGVLAFFGAPVSHEDDAERAARAGLSILVAIDGYSAEVARGWGVERFAVRVGVSTGLVALGPIGAGTRVEYAAFGDAVNTAARLQSVAGPGTVLMDSQTQREIKDLFQWSAPRDLELKGKLDPVRVFGLQAALPASSRLRGGSVPVTAIIGRDHELSILQRAIDDLRAGSGSVVSISGQAGVGKSRLLADVLERSETRLASSPPFLWLEGRCASYGEGVPYFPVRDLLHNWLGVSDGDPEVRVRIALRRAVDQLFQRPAGDAYKYLAALLGIASDDHAGGPEPEVAAEELQQRIFAAVGALLDRMAQDRPVVVALEDLHWADATSTKLVRSLLPIVERSAVLLVMTQRDERDHAAWALKEVAARDFPHLVREVVLDSLPPLAEQLLLDELVGVGTLSKDLRHRLLDAAGGNPLFLEELVRSLVDAGALVRGEEGNLRHEHDVPIAIPQTVERVILARADRLPTDCRETLTAASVAGRRFDLTLLTDLVGSDDSLQQTLHDLLRLGFIEQERRWPQPQYRFKHVLIQEAIYRTMLAEQRTRLHRAAAESLEGLARDTQEDALALARHWEGAGESLRAIPYYRRGAELAIRGFANEEAVEALDHALDLLDQEPATAARDEIELDIRIMLGVPLVVRGGWGTLVVRDDYMRARELCLRVGRPVSPPILRGLAIGSVIRLELAEARGHGLALLDIAEREQDSVLLVEANYVLGVTTFWTGDFPQSRDFLQEAIARYAPAHSDRHIALYSQDPKVICLCRMGWTLWHLGYPQRAAAARDEAIALAEEMGHPLSLCYAYGLGAIISTELYDGRRAAELLSALEVVATDKGLHFWELFAAVYKHWPAAQTDPQAIEPMKSAIKDFDGTGQTLWKTYFLSLVARAQLSFGDHTAGLESITVAVEETRRTGAWYLDSELQRLRGELLHAADAAAGEIESAFRRAYDIAVRQEAKSLELRAAVALTRWQVERGLPVGEDDLQMLSNACDWFTEGGAPDELTSARQLLAQLI
jgi:class 3 adenylate cyclase/tetratricopeptide (TPR) repeat protein